jgi:hypothetical protein
LHNRRAPQEGLAIARKKPKKKFRAVKAVKAKAREAIGAPRPTRRESQRRPDAEKHKPTLGDLLGNDT